MVYSIVNNINQVTEINQVSDLPARNPCYYYPGNRNPCYYYPGNICVLCGFTSGMAQSSGKGLISQGRVKVLSTPKLGILRLHILGS